MRPPDLEARRERTRRATSRGVVEVGPPCGQPSGSPCRHQVGGRYLLGGCGEQRHRALGEVVVADDLSLVVGLDQERRRPGAAAPRDWGTRPRRRTPLDLLVEPFQRVSGPGLLPVGDRERGERQQLLGVVAQHRLEGGNCRLSIPATTLSCSRTWVASGWAKMVRTAAATISAEPFGTRRAGCAGSGCGRAAPPRRP